MEQSIYLPETFWCFQPVDEAKCVKELPAFTNGYVTFGSLNKPSKVTGATLAVWSELLRAQPQSRLLLHAHLAKHQQRASNFFDQRNISPDRITFVKKMALAEYLAAFGQIDIALDSFPWSGGTTTFNALWMGVPVVTLAGQTALGRGGVSILSNIGLPELVASDGEQYVRIAADLAQDLSRLSELRATMRDRMRASPLMDAPRFARNVEAAYREMWKRWCLKPLDSSTAP